MVQNKIRVLVMIKGFGLGGAERLIIDALPYLNRDRFYYEFLYLVPKKNLLVSEIERNGFKVSCISTPNFLYFIRTLCRLLIFLKNGKFDLIHAHMPFSGILARLAGKLIHIPVVYTEHNLQERFHFLSKYINIFTYSSNNHIIAVSDHVKQSIQRFSPRLCSRVSVIRNSIPLGDISKDADSLTHLRQELKIPEGHRVIGTVAVFRKQKAIKNWLVVAQEVIKDNDQVSFVLIGNGPLRKEVEADIKRLGLLKRVILPGLRADARKCIGLFDIFLITSQYEGLPVVLLEAMAQKVPVVSTSVGGIPEVINNREEGLLVNYGDNHGAACAINLLLADKDLGTYMAEKAYRRLVKEFNFEENIKQIEDIYIKELAGGVFG